MDDKKSPSKSVRQQEASTSFLPSTSNIDELIGGLKTAAMMDNGKRDELYRGWLKLAEATKRDMTGEGQGQVDDGMGMDLDDE